MGEAPGLFEKRVTLSGMRQQQQPTPLLGPVGYSRGPAQLLAYVDESMRVLPDGTKCYYLAAAMISETACAATRDILRPLLLGREPRLHWTREGEPRKNLIAKTISQIPVECVVLVGAMLQHKKEDRARHQVLKHLLWELDQNMNVRHVVLESRGASQDRRDLTIVGGLRNSKHLSRRLIVSHGQPIQEPLLWIADAVAGAAGDQRCGNPSHYQSLGTRASAHGSG